MRHSLIEFIVASISNRILLRLRFGVFQQNRPEADIAGRTLEIGRGHYWKSASSRKEEAFALEEAVRRMTSDPADFFGIKTGEGLRRARRRTSLSSTPAPLLQEATGATVRRAGRADVHGYHSKGIEMTLVNGVMTWEKGALTGAAAGKVLRS
jgi:N-acyl-D-aspartate/D-glutamate deacylase